MKKELKNQEIIKYLLPLVVQWSCKQPKQIDLDRRFGARQGDQKLMTAAHGGVENISAVNKNKKNLNKSFQLVIFLLLGSNWLHVTDVHK